MDKIAHFLGGMIASLVFYPLGTAVAVIAGLAVAVAKEAYDLITRKGDPEVADVVATLGGTFAVVVPLHALGPNDDFYFWTLWGLYGFWAVYVLMMGMYRTVLAGRVSPILISLGGPLMAVAFLVDIVMQMTLATIVFMDRPRHWLVTSRLTYYLHRPPSDEPLHRYQTGLARWICHHLLDPLDPTGEHCDRGIPKRSLTDSVSPEH